VAGSKFPYLTAMKEKQFVGSDDDSEAFMSKLECATELREKIPTDNTTQLKMTLFLKIGRGHVMNKKQARR
jgi:hypothetical protein